MSSSGAWSIWLFPFFSDLAVRHRQFLEPAVGRNNRSACFNNSFKKTHMFLKVWFPEHFWKLTCQKIARRCGAKHMSKSKVLKNWRFRTTFRSWDVQKTVRSQKCTKHTRFGAQMLNNCTPLWRKARFQVKMLKTPHARTAFEVSDVVLRHLSKKRWQVWDISRGSAKMYFAWQAQYKRHVHQRC